MLRTRRTLESSDSGREYTLTILNKAKARRRQWRRRLIDGTAGVGAAV
jgi:hypothetical protein